MLSIKKTLSKLLDASRPQLLYSGSFTNGSVTLSKAVSNYKRIILVYKDNDGTTFTREVINDKANSFVTCCESIRITGESYFKAMLIQFNGTTMASSYNRQGTRSAAPTQGTFITLQKVYGCTNLVGGGTA